jgi:hypothetical protein
VYVLSRQPESVKSLCGYHVQGIGLLSEIDDMLRIDVVINLAGAPIADQRWSEKRKRKLEASRIDLTHSLVDWIAQRPSKPDVLVSGSAVGWYGDQGDAIVTETSHFHDEYTHTLCEAWEQAALKLTEHDVRVCISRTGLVLSIQGGVLAKMLLPFKLGLGGVIGNGQQYMPWIHIEDMATGLLYLADNQTTEGIYNLCSPSPVTNQTFTNQLASQLNRPALLPVPALPLQWLLGEMSRLLLTGQRALPTRLTESGFQFHYTELHHAFSDLLSN